MKIHRKLRSSVFKFSFFFYRVAFRWRMMSLVTFLFAILLLLPCACQSATCNENPGISMLCSANGLSLTCSYLPWTAFPCSETYPSPFVGLSLSQMLHSSFIVLLIASCSLSLSFFFFFASLDKLNSD